MGDVHRGCAAALTLTLALAACGGSEAAPLAFEITDSAGVVLARNPAEPADPSLAPRLVPDLRIGVVDGATEYQFDNIFDVREGPRGEIYVLDRGTLDVKVYDVEGTHLRTLGRSGDGPGELRQPTVLGLGAADTVYVLDGIGSAGRIHTFAPDGSLVRTVRFAAPGTLTSQPPFTEEGDVIAGVSRTGSGSGDLLIRIDGRTAAIDTLLELQPARELDAPLRAPAPAWTRLDDGRVVVGRTDEYRFVYHTASGEVERVVTRSVFPHLLTEAEKQSILDYQRAIYARMRSPSAQGMAEGLRVADMSTVYADLMAGPRGSLWVLQPVGMEPEESLTYDVFDSEGRHLGAVPMIPARTWASGEHVYQMVTDELGVPYLQRYRIEWGDSE